jgi:ADP-ribose pyrophosphatase YjhB (NUDIX family)
MTHFTIGSFAVIFDKKDRVLLCHRRDQDIWNLPGGGVESGELPNEAVIRETLEETGLKIKILELVGIYGKSNKDEFIFVFLGKITGGKIKKTDEADETRYFKLKNIPKNTIPKHVGRIRDAAKKRSKPIFRWQHNASTWKKHQ